MWGTKNHRNTDGLKTGFQWAKYMVQKISSAQSLKYFNKNLFCSQVIAIHVQKFFHPRGKGRRTGLQASFKYARISPRRFCSAAQRSKRSSAPPEGGGSRWREARLCCLGKSLYSCLKSERVHSPNLTTSLIQKEYPIIVASHILWANYLTISFSRRHFTSDLCISQAFLCLKRSEGYITISGDQAAGWSL